AGQDAEPGTDLEDTRAGSRLGEIENRLEHVRIGEEVLRLRVTGPEALPAQDAPDLQRVESSRAGRCGRGGARGHLASGSDGVASRSRPARSPRAPRPPPPAPLSAPR